MARIRDVKLDIRVDGTPSSMCTVEYTITWSALDISANLGYHAKVELWGDDWSNDFLTTLVKEDVYPNGQDTLTLTRQKLVSNGSLDEDPAWGDGDEFFAKVRLKDKGNQFPALERNSRNVNLSL